MTVRIEIEANTVGGLPCHTYLVTEEVERIGWRRKPIRLNPFPAFKWSAYLTSPQLPGSFVVTNAWTRRGAIRKAQALWFKHVRFVTEDDACSILCGFFPPDSGEGV